MDIKTTVRDVSFGAAGEGSSSVTAASWLAAMAPVQSPAEEIPDVTGGTPRPQKNPKHTKQNNHEILPHTIRTAIIKKTKR